MTPPFMPDDDELQDDELALMFVKPLERIAASLERIERTLARAVEVPNVELVECERCAGEGTIGGTIPCELCKGLGRVPKATSA